VVTAGAAGLEGAAATGRIGHGAAVEISPATTKGPAIPAARLLYHPSQQKHLTGRVKPEMLDSGLCRAPW